MNYNPTIGLEVHVELNTNTKLTSGSLNKYGQTPNTLVTPGDLGHPGTLPRINKRAIQLGIQAAHVFNCEIAKTVRFDRKNYYYPDNPHNYQITQQETPIGANGYLEININDNVKKINIERIHIEEDTAKSNHQDNYTLLDFNRSGVPLIEIVTKPNINSSKEAILFLEQLKEILYYTGISEAKMEEGNIRIDANVSVSNDSTFGNKTEIKNIGSIANVGLAIDLEVKRQIDILESGGTINGETRRLDETNNQTVLMREKTEKNDYRYFPEANIPTFNLSDNFIKNALDSLPVLPDERRSIFKMRLMSDQNIEKIMLNREFCDFLLQLDESVNLERGANILLEDIAAYLNKENIKLSDTKLTKEKFSEVVKLLESNMIQHRHFKEFLNDLLTVDILVEDLVNLVKKSNISTDELTNIIDEVINNNQDNVNEYKKGRTNLLQFFVGQVLKQTKGAADPQKVTEMITRKLAE